MNSRRLLTLALLLALTFLLGTGAGYLYAHDPQRDVLTIALESGAPAGDAPLSGTVVEANGGRLRLDTANGPVDVTLPAGAHIEELRSIALSELTPGTAVNVGIERTESSASISGIVTVQAQ